LFSGVARVFKIGENGREITLYRFSDGESCILTASCILGNHTFPAIAQIECEAEALLIPAPVYYEWMNRHAFWRDYTFALLSNRLAAVMSILDEVAFRRMDARVAELLLRRAASAGDVIRITHQEIAAELGTSREVVSRILEDLHARGALIAGRGLITLADRQKLRSW
jgi:CRP/FNR family transcriptional regulator